MRFLRNQQAVFVHRKHEDLALNLTREYQQKNLSLTYYEPVKFQTRLGVDAFDISASERCLPETRNWYRPRCGMHPLVPSSTKCFVDVHFCIHLFHFDFDQIHLGFERFTLR